MYQVLFLSFIFYELSSGKKPNSRLLLQTNPFTDLPPNPFSPSTTKTPLVPLIFMQFPLPVQVPPESTTTPPVDVVLPITPGTNTNGIPTNPEGTNPENNGINVQLPGDPGFGAQTPSNPQSPPPGLPEVSSPPQIIPNDVVLPLGTAPINEINCGTSYHLTGAEGNCHNQEKTFTNPAQNLKVKCDGLASCAQTHWTFDYLPGGYVDRIEGIWFKEEWAGFDTVITINNQQGNGNKLNVDYIECADNGACENLLLRCMNCGVNDIKCDSESYCRNCRIEMCDLWTCDIKPCWGY